MKTTRYAAGFSAGLWLMLSLPVAAQGALDSGDFNPGDMVEQWLSLEVQRGRLVSAWHDRQIILDQQIALLDKEAESLQALIDDHASTTSDTDRERAEILKQQTMLEQQQQELQRMVDVGVHQVMARAHRLPPPLQDAFQPQFAQLQNEKLTLSDRLDVLLQLLTELHDFNQRIAIHKGALELPAISGAGVRKIHVTQVYMGAARGWYVSADGTHFGYGESRNDGWRWWHGNDARDLLNADLTASAVTHLVTLVQSPEDAALGDLPLRVDPPLPQQTGILE